MLVAKIDRDYINNGDYAEFNRVGKEFNLVASQAIPGIQNAPTVRFRCLDDDREVYYGGWLLNDMDCEVQAHICNWATADAGAIHIQVLKDGVWTYEIG